MAFALVVTTLAFLSAFVLAGSTSAHLGFSRRASRELRARLLAEAAVTRAVAEIVSNPKWGSEGESVQVSLAGNPSGSVGRLTFQQGSDNYSTFNLDSDSSRPGLDNRLVPAHSIHLVGEGHCLGLSRRVEAVLTLPPFPYAIASGGSIRSDGELLVGSLSGTESSGPISADNLSPAHLASNGRSEDSVLLGPRTMVIGDVRSAGGLRLSHGAVVKGQTLAYGQPVALPEIPLQSYDPEGRQVGYQILPSEVSDTTVAGTARAPGDLTVYGGLTLEQGKLYVKGHLTVRGPVAGQGLVVAQQGITVYTGARVTGGRAVLLSGGDVSIQGGGPLGSFFQGMVYSEGGFQASDITVVGSFIAKGELSGVKLSNARVIGDASSTVWQPEFSHTFHFVRGDSLNEPAVQVAEASSASFSIVARLVKGQNQRYEVQVVHPGDGETRTYDSVHVAARHIAVIANDTARLLPADGQPSTGTNLVAAAETLEDVLQRKAQQLVSDQQEVGFDLNQFFGISDRLRVRLWRNL